MPFQPVPNVMQLNLEATLWGEQCVTTFYYRKNVPPIASIDLENATVAAVVAVDAELTDVLPDSWEFVRAVATDLTAEPQLQSITLATPGTVGAQVSTMPGNVCMSIKRASAFIGRSFRGRVYWPLWDAALSDTDANLSSPTIAANIVAAITAFDNAMAGEGWTPVIVSRQQGGVVLAEGEAYDIVGWSVADFVADSQRRRLAGRGS